MGTASLTFLLAALATLPIVAPAVAAERHTTMAVGAFVQPRIDMRVADPPQALHVSAADVHAGYVEAAIATVLEVRTSSREGYAVEIRPLHPALAEVDIAYGAGIARMAGEPVRLVRRTGVTPVDRLTLRYRFRLPSTLPPGVYPWPLDVMATPL